MKASKEIGLIRKEGLNALVKKLGPDGMIRFIQQYSSGSGDYTRDRHLIIDDYSIDEIVKEIKNK